MSPVVQGTSPRAVSDEDAVRTLIAVTPMVGCSTAAQSPQPQLDPGGRCRTEQKPQPTGTLE
jgi:hypothetical protein